MMSLRTPAALFCFTVFIGCAREAERAPASVISEPLREQAAVQGPLFADLPIERTGIDFTNHLESRNVKKYLANGAGVAIGDVDGDDLPDVYLVCQDGPNRLYRQLGDLRFEDVTERAGVDGGDAWGSGASFADVDDDGDLDLYVCSYDRPNLLYVNRGDGTFDEQAAARGVAHPGASMVGSFADYDRDGDLDLYLLNNRKFAVKEEAPQVKALQVDGRLVVHPDYADQYMILDGHMSEAGQRDRLYRNDGTGRFEDVTDAAGIRGFDMGLSVTWWDHNADGWLDLYVGNDLKSPDHLYANRGDGTFVDVLRGTVPHTPWFSMGADTADLNGDGVLDLLVADMSATTHYKQKVSMGSMADSGWFLTYGEPRQYMRNALYVSTGTQRMLEAATLAGVDSTDWTWSVKFADFDLDGRSDVFFTNGVGRNMNDSDLEVRAKQLLAEGRGDEAFDLVYEMPPLEENNLAFRYLGDLRFEDVSAAWGLDWKGVSQGAALADLDRDGDLDLVINNMNAPARVYRNDVRGNRALIRLRGTRSNRFGVGAKLTLEAGGVSQTRRAVPVRGYISCDDGLVHFGLGDATRIDRLTVEWPSGVVDTLTGLEANRLLTIAESDVEATPAAARASLPKRDAWFRKTDVIEHRHRERAFDDYAREPLLPNALSQLGPGFAWGDADGDGDDDLFVGGAAGAGGLLWLRDGARFKPTSGPWSADAESEDMGALWLDLDADGDEDLYVVSGGVECDPGDAALRDRVYLNQGGGDFAEAADVLPDHRDSGSAIAAADFDRDGDLDVFVGGRVIPGRYPLAARSRLYRNDSGRLVDVAAEAAPGLEEVGLVTSALWTDTDGDGLVDLVVACEWGPVHVFKSRGDGTLADHTEAAGLATETGWWNGLASGDVDGDGDVDLVATNFGLNHKYHASPEHPALLYVSDFDQNGALDLVEAEYEGETCFPVRGRSCSSAAMPFISEKFPTFDEFGKASLEGIYSRVALEGAKKFAATRLETALLRNDGSGRFELEPLPRLAQIAPSFGVELADWDGDGDLDVALAQNFFGPQPETGRMDGGLSLLLLGDGRGGFAPMSPGDSGIVVPGDATALTRADLDGDRLPDLVIACNDGPLHAYTQTAQRHAPSHSIRLAGAAGNPRAIGARVTVRTSAGREVVREIKAGGSYLGQSPPTAEFALRPGEAVEVVRVRWPDGAESEHGPDAIPSTGRATLRHPSKG